MRITSVSVFKYNLPVMHPLPVGGGALGSRQGLLVRLQSRPGAVGWGEVAPLPGLSRENLDHATRQLLDLKPALLDHAWPDESPGAVDIGSLGPTLGDTAPSVRFGLEQAVDSLGNAEGKAHGEVSAPFEPAATLAVNGLLYGTAEESYRQAEKLRAEGYTCVKLKVGRRSVEEDIAQTLGVRQALGPDLGLRLDANRAWSFEQAVTFGRGVAAAGVEYIEEPLADGTRLGAWAAATGVPVALDETLIGRCPENILAGNEVVAFILKPTLLGGLARVRAFAEKALALGARPVVTSVFESGVGIRGLALLAGSLSRDPAPAGLDTYRWLAEDVLEPRLHIEDGRIDLSTLWEREPSVRLEALEVIA